MFALADDSSDEADFEDPSEKPTIPFHGPETPETTSRHTQKVSDPAFLDDIDKCRCCSFDCLSKFTRDSKAQLLQEWDCSGSAIQRKQKSYDLLKHSQVSTKNRNRPVVVISRMPFEISLRCTQGSRLHDQVVQLHVCYGALQKLTAVHKSVWRENANQLLQNLPQPACVTPRCLASSFKLIHCSSLIRQRKKRNEANDSARAAVFQFLQRLCSYDNHDAAGYKLDQESRREVFDDYIDEQDQKAERMEPSFKIKRNTCVHLTITSSSNSYQLLL